MKGDDIPHNSSFARQREDIEREEEWYCAIVTGDTEPGAPVIRFPLLSASAIYDAIAGVADAFRRQDWTSRIAGEQGFTAHDEFDDAFRPAYATVVDAGQRLVVGIQLAPTFLVLMPAFNEEETARIRQHQQVLETEVAHLRSQPGGDIVASYLARQIDMIGLHLADTNYRHHHEMKAIKSFISAGGTLEWFTPAEKHQLN